MNGAQALVELLAGYETQVIFGLPGDTSVDLYDALRAGSGRIRHVMARDERSAACMADVYARLSGKPGVCEGPSGGGATYMLPGVAEAHGSSVALVALTSDNPISYESQGALTALDQPQIYRPVTKWTAVAKRAGQIPGFVRRAFRLATSGRPGAVHLSLPKDVLAEEIHTPVRLEAEARCFRWPTYRTRPDPAAVEQAVEHLLRAKRPVIIAGGGVVSSGAHAELAAVASRLQAPVATTINGKGAIAEVHPLSLGVIGANGGRPYAARAVQTADLVLFAGSKVNYVDTDSWRLPDRASPPAIVQIDVDPSELGNTYPVTTALCGDAKLALADLLTALPPATPPPDRGDWLAGIAQDKAAWKALVERTPARVHGRFHPRWIIQELQRVLPPDAVLIADPGTPTPYLSAEFELRQAGRWAITPRAQGGLGYAIPGVTGARLARPEQPVIGLCGDGSFAMSAGDLATIARTGGPTVLILFNNGAYGWIKALQHLYHEGRYFSVDFPEELDYVQVAHGFGLPGMRLRTAAELGPAVLKALAQGRPSFIEVATLAEHQASPPVAPWQRAASSGPADPHAT